ncbi:RluA family pseudouridine synthase [Emcibacter sp.]|uniref:RluA family pseudouridine synthase n=1 Tax=Emcibacter sp. TaxID=1979954 RepID=UPI002AA798B1|nr:RluA family pseudouridine synthase [Emcibacter sp.]
MTNNDPETYELTVEDEDKGLRLDKFLATHLPEISRSRLKQLITESQVLIGPENNQQTIDDPSHRVKPDERFQVKIPDLTEPDPEGEDIPLDIVYEDDDLIVLNKQAGMVVHPAPGSRAGTLVNALIHHCGDSLSGINGVKRPGIVHRIDKDTSGLMVVAKSDKAHKKLAKQFANHSMERAYLAVVWGVPNPADGMIEANIGRDPKNRLRMGVVETGGKYALTNYRVIRRLEPPRQVQKTGGGKKIRAAALPPSISLVQCELETGRTHQVRVHMAAAGHPLIGDPLYGRQNPPIRNFSEKARAAVLGFKRQALHAYVIGFKHPVTGEHLKFESELPNDMKRLITALES